MIQLAENQLGTVGSGNHYVNLMEDERGLVWVGVHFGSRGFGHKTASGFLALAEGKRFDERAHEGEMDSPPVLFEVGSELGESYISAMQLAGAQVGDRMSWLHSHPCLCEIPIFRGRAVSSHF